MPDPQRSLKVFLCHASQDKPAVRELSRRLADEGWIDPWVDEKKLLPGQDWRAKIEEAVETSDIVIICLSSNSVTKEGHVQKEVRYAREIAFEKPDETIFLIPLRLDNCIVPRGLRFFQWGDYFGEKKEEAYSALIESLKLRYDQKLVREEQERIQKEKVTQEIAERIAGEKAERKAIEEAAHEKQGRGTAERAEQQKTTQQELEHETAEKAVRKGTERRLRALKRKIKWEGFLSGVRYRLNVIRIYSLPIMFFSIAVGVLIFGLFYLQKNYPIPTQAFSSTLTQSTAPAATSLPTETLLSTHTPSPSSTPTKSITQTFLPLPTEITDAKDVPMMLVPAGKFTMGSENGESNERPVHTVDLDAYYIDKYEVTNGLYKVCVDAGVCQAPKNTTSLSFYDLYGKSEYNNYPVMFISWNMAKTFCEWRGARLPTEAEWEKAARGTDGRTYPWGNQIDQTFAHYGQSGGTPVAVGSYPSGKSPYGVYDMAGNLSEWVEDWYSQSFYSNSPLSNPSGPGNGLYRVYRGGTWYDDKDKVRAANRNFYKPDEILESIGFRCAKDATP